jgi:medium-chain acyl-[acyl-carrier-protein] hydrolase
LPTIPWLLRPVPAARAAVRLFCFPYAGVGGSVYVPWARELAPAIEVCAVQLPGRESRLGEPAHVGLPELLAGMVPALEAELSGPYVLFGHSMGALIAFELARELRRRAKPGPALLVVSGRRAPHLGSRSSPFAHLSDAEFLAEIRRRYDGIPDEVLRHPDLMALLLPGLRADIGLIERYAFEEAPALDCPIVAFGGHHDPEANDAEVAAWRQHTSATFTHQRFPGNHFFIRSARAELVAAISASVDHVRRWDDSEGAR